MKDPQYFTIKPLKTHVFKGFIVKYFAIYVKAYQVPFPIPFC
jgi:hypothetical protein